LVLLLASISITKAQNTFYIPRKFYFPTPFETYVPQVGRKMATSTLNTTAVATSTPTNNPLIPLCGGGGSPEMLINMTQPYCGMGIQSYDNASIAMRSCCNGADFIIPETGCAIYCKVEGQTSQQLANCLSNFALKQGYRNGILCSSDAMATRGIDTLSQVLMVVMGLLTVTLAPELL
jgi:hypothetical protein